MNIFPLLSHNLNAMPRSKMTAFFDLPDDVISLALGEPGFSTPLSAAQGGIDAIINGKTLYSPSRGYLALRQKTSDYLRERFGFSYSSDEITITVGASLAIDCIMRAFLNDGDEIIIPSPAYGYYASLTALAGGQAVFAPTRREDDWVLTAEALKQAISPRTKLLILNYPNNPTGAVMSNEQFAAIAEVLKSTNILVISDEIYAECVYKNPHSSILHQIGMRERSFLVSGFSKVMAMTGWRVGYVCAPQELLSPVSAISAAVSLCAPGISQSAALRGLENSARDINLMNGAYKTRRDYAISALVSMGFDCSLPGGAFYLFADISSSGMNSEAFAQELLKNHKVAVMPGTVFGDEFNNYIRVTFSRDMEVLTEGLNRIEAFARDLKM